jgi:hypothetical protein
MTEPTWLAATLAAFMLLVAVGCVARLAIWRLRGRSAEPEADALHVVMGVAMAGMFQPGIRLGLGAAWIAVFATAAVWFAVRAIGTRRRDHRASALRSRAGDWRSAHPAVHSVESAAMIYMLVPASVGSHAPVMRGMPGMPGAPGPANPALAFVLALFMLGSVVWTADRLTKRSRPQTAAVGGAESGSPEGLAAAGGAASAALAPLAAECSKIAMSLVMGYMLLTML